MIHNPVLDILFYKPLDYLWFIALRYPRKVVVILRVAFSKPKAIVNAKESYRTIHFTYMFFVHYNSAFTINEYKTPLYEPPPGKLITKVLVVSASIFGVPITVPG